MTMQELLLGLREKFLEAGFDLGLLPDGKTFVFRPCFWEELKLSDIAEFSQAVGKEAFSNLLFKYLVNRYLEKLDRKVRAFLRLNKQAVGRINER